MAGAPPYSVRQLQRGINTEGANWGKKPALALTDADFATLRQLGFDHVRLSFNTLGVADAIPHLHRDVEAALRHDLTVVLDLHWLLDARKNIRSVDDPESPGILRDCWELFSAECRSRYPNNVMAYDLLNEPKGESWNAVCRDLFARVREHEPERTLIVGPVAGGVEHLDELDVSWADANTILTFHIYQPYQLTHYGIRGAPIGFYEGPIHYPGPPLRPEDLAELSPEQCAIMEKDNVHYDAQHLRHWFSGAAEASWRSGLPVYCGEFGCNSNVPQDVRLRWITDMRIELEKLGFAWAVYAHKGLWRTVWNDDGTIDEQMVRALLG